MNPYIHEFMPRLGVIRKTLAPHQSFIAKRSTAAGLRDVAAAEVAV